MATLPALTGLILLPLFIALIFFFSARVANDRVPALRPIAAFDSLKDLMTQTIEAGRRVHISIGSGALTDITSAETLAGLTVLEHFSAQAAASKMPPIITTADPVVLLAAQNVMRKAYGVDHQGAVQSAAQVRWLSPNPAAYAAGVMGILALDGVDGNMMIGHFGDEYLLMAETAHRQSRDVATVAGAANPNVLPYVFATAPNGLWGEEMFAAGAYLDRKPAHIGSLLAQDTLRWGIGLFILGGVLLKLFGVG